MDDALEIVRGVKPASYGWLTKEQDDALARVLAVAVANVELKRLMTLDARIMAETEMPTGRVEAALNAVDAAVAALRTEAANESL